MPIQENLSQILDSSEFEVTEKNIYYSRPTTVFAAVAASIFTIIGVLGRLIFFIEMNVYTDIGTHDKH